jgi:alpha-1,3-rhamnosyl/mannosyltransferase
VATIVHDVSYIRHSDTFPAALAWRLKLLTPITLRRSRLLVTVSEFSRHELLDVYPWLDPDKIVVTPNAPSERLFDEPAPTELERVRAEYQLPDAFVLTVGNLQPRKNLPRLADATVALDLPLIVCGQSGWEQQKVSPALSASSVRWLGYVPDGDLSVLYRLCTLMAYPSLYEGFGLPVIEAMAAGAPVVTSNSSALEEVAAGCAELVDPTDVKSIKSGLERVWSSPSRQTELRQLGRARAVEFTWARSATVLIDRLRAVV